MKKFFIALLVIAFAGITSPATAAAAKSLTLDCFVSNNGGYPSDAYCTQVGPDDYQVGTHLGRSAGVYTVNASGRDLNTFSSLRFQPIGPVDTVNENCSPLAICQGWTSPQVVIPVDLDGNTRGSASQDDVVRIPAHSCTNAAGVVDITNDSTCKVYARGPAVLVVDPVTGDVKVTYPQIAFANWAAYIAFTPTASVSPKSGGPWIEVDHAYGEGDWTLQDVQFTTG